MFDFLERHRELAAEAAAAAERHVEFERQREEAAEAQRALERERARPALERAKAEQEARRLERERVQQERAQAAARDARVRTLISERDELAAMRVLTEVLATRTDPDAVQWLAHAKAWLDAQQPNRPRDAPLPARLVAAEVPRFTPVPTAAQEVFELATPPLPTTLQGAKPYIKQLRENRVAAHRHERYRRRWRSSFPRTEYARRELEKLGPLQPHSGVPVFEVQYEQLRLALLIVHAVMRLGLHAKADVSYGSGWGDTMLRLYVLDREEFTLSVTGAHPRGGLAYSLRVKLEQHEIVVASFEEFAERWEELVQSIPATINRRRAERAAQAAAHTNGELAAQRAAEQQRRRNLLRYREQTLQTLAIQHDHATAARQLLRHDQLLADAERDDLALWLAAHDLGEAEVVLPVYEPERVPELDEPEPPPKLPSTSKSSWERPPKSWFQRRHGWWNQ